MNIQQMLDMKGDRLITLPSNSTIVDVSKALSFEQIGTVILVDVEGKIAGIVSERDLVSSIARDGGPAIGIRADQMMTRSVIVCTAETSLDNVLELMRAHAVRHIPVVNEEKPVGMVSIRDILNFQREQLLTDSENSKLIERNVIESQRYLEDQSRRLEEVARYLAEARDEAERANRAKSEFIANMSHEFRTPLNAIIGFSDVMRSETLGPIENSSYQGYVIDIFEAGNHLLALVNDILDLSKIEAEEDVLYEELFDVSEVVDSITTLVRERAAKGNVKLDFEIEDDTPALYADKRKVKQILANLLTNAIKFTEPGGEVMTKIWSRPESGFVIQILDTGIGIAPVDIPKALSQFGQVDSALGRKYEGTGLGLPLTKSLVELHGGSFDLQSKVGVGTTITVRFPAVRTEYRELGPALSRNE